MNYTVDFEYRDALRYILKNGKSHEDNNRIGVYRLNVPKYTLNIPIDTVPAVSIKKSFPVSAAKELSLFMRGVTDIRIFWEAKVNFWNADFMNFVADKTDKDLQYIKDNQEEFDDEFFSLGKIYGYQYRNFAGSGYDQMAELLRKMIEKPMNSDLVVSAWNPPDFKNMSLKPCHWSFSVDMEKRMMDTYGFHLTFNMRSSDFYLGAPMNIMFYFLLGKILERVTKHKFLSLTGDLHNVHIYSPHVKQAKEVAMNRPKHIQPLSNLEFDPYLDEPLKELEDYKSFWNNLPLIPVKLTKYQSYRHYPAELLTYS